MSSKLKVKAGLKEYLLLMASLEAPGPDEQAALLMASRQGDEGAFRSLVEGYLPKVVRLVSSRRGEALSFQELIGLGNAAVLETVKQYRGSAVGLEAAVAAAVHDALDHALKLNA